jgi:hypothetical protein
VVLDSTEKCYEGARLLDRLSNVVTPVLLGSVINDQINSFDLLSL